MDNRTLVVNQCPLQIPNYYPENTNFSTETENLGIFTMCENNAETSIPLSILDDLTFVLPPTPEGSLNSGSENGEAFLLEDMTASSVPGNIPSNILQCPKGLDVILPVDANLQSQVDNMLQARAYSQTKQSEKCTVLLSTFDSQAQALLPKHIVHPPHKVSLSENNIDHVREKEQQKESRDDMARGISLDEIDSTSVVTITAKSSVIQENGLSSNSKEKKKASNSLKYPPCVICSGKASGSHYGEITCEACKGFFRRFLQKKTQFKCTTGGKCEILSSKRGNCSACRLKKCLALGMSKEKSKMGRYTLTKRTESIIKMKVLEGKIANDPVIEESEVLPVENGIEANSFRETDLIMRYLLQNTKTLNLSHGFNDMLVSELVKALDHLEPYGPNIKTKEQITEAHILQSERYKRKTELFGKMNAIPRDEFNKLYKEFGIDIDGRMADMKIECEDLEDDIARYCNFAKHIPGFHNLPLQDQAHLLKALMADFYAIVLLDSYNEEYRTFISKNGHGYHFDEVADREYSEKLITLMMNFYRRLQMLNLTKDETALISALTLVSTDRCKLQSPALVEKIQLALTKLLQLQIKKREKQEARRRFTKIIDSLTFMREMGELFTKENKLLCTDEVVIQEFPFAVDFMVEENY